MCKGNGAPQEKEVGQRRRSVKDGHRGREAAGDPRGEGRGDGEARVATPKGGNRAPTGGTASSAGVRARGQDVRGAGGPAPTTTCPARAGARRPARRGGGPSPPTARRRTCPRPAPTGATRRRSGRGTAIRTSTYQGAGRPVRSRGHRCRRHRRRRRRRRASRRTPSAAGGRDGSRACPDHTTPPGRGRPRPPEGRFPSSRSSLSTPGVPLPASPPPLRTWPPQSHRVPLLDLPALDHGLPPTRTYPLDTVQPLSRQRTSSFPDPTRPRVLCPAPTSAARPPRGLQTPFQKRPPAQPLRAPDQALPPRTPCGTSPVPPSFAGAAVSLRQTPGVQDGGAPRRSAVLQGRGGRGSPLPFQSFQKKEKRAGRAGRRARRRGRRGVTAPAAAEQSLRPRSPTRSR